jgi:hypothetical protein
LEFDGTAFVAVLNAELHALDLGLLTVRDKVGHPKQFGVTQSVWLTIFEQRNRLAFKPIRAW